MKIEGNVFVVTGGASGLGGATAAMIVAQGGKVVIADVNVDGGRGACGQPRVGSAVSASAT